MYDVIIVGGGPAGLSAATVLGRCRRSVLLCDDGRYRNAASHALHAFLTRDGIDPAELRRIGREQLNQYGVECRAVRVTAAGRTDGGFEVVLADDSRLAARHLLLATGVVDCIPAVEGMEHFFGAGVFHCPCCDGWEVRDQPLAAYGSGKDGAGLAASLKQWSADVVLCTDGPTRFPVPMRAAWTGWGFPSIRRKSSVWKGPRSWSAWYFAMARRCRGAPFF